MVPWWKRLAYSLLSVMAAVIVTCTFSDFWESKANSNAHVSANGLLLFVCYALIFSIPGWLLALPIVFVVANFRGWRFWMYWVIGSAIGPVVILGFALYSFLKSPKSAGFSPPIELVYLAAAVSSLTTLIYLLLTKRAQRQRPQRTTEPAKELTR